MLIPNHPHDERLSALSMGDPEAAADAALTEHVASCVRCTDTVAELGALRASLAELPDLQPHRPLQLLPPVADMPARADRVGGWARRFFAPMLTAGAALALVGIVGTASPLLGGLASSGAAASMEAAELGQGNAGAALDDEGGTDTDQPVAAPSAHELAAGGSDAGASSRAEAATGSDGGDQPLSSEAEVARPAGSSSDGQQQAFADEDRSVWPMLLFAGVAIMIAAALLRWILAPRAG
jgi:hypothetical protein